MKQGGEWRTDGESENDGEWNSGKLKALSFSRFRSSKAKARPKLEDRARTVTDQGTNKHGTYKQIQTIIQIAKWSIIFRGERMAKIILILVGTLPLTAAYNYHSTSLQ